MIVVPLLHDNHNVLHLGPQTWSWTLFYVEQGNVTAANLHYQMVFTTTSPIMLLSY